MNGRNFTFLAQLGAGMQTPQADTRGNAASGAFSANGLRPSQNNYLLDGIDNNSNAVDFLNGTNFVILPPVDAIQEFKVQTANFSAELGRSAGAVMNATIKSGTNSLHGAAWEFFRNDVLDAADYFENNTGTPKGKLRQNQFGASIGGPIIKNKIFFFGDYEGFRRVQGSPSNGNVPTKNERSSGYTNFADIFALNDGSTRTDLLDRAVQKGTVLDPATTRFVAAGAADPVTGLVNNTGKDGYVRDPFGYNSCLSPNGMTITVASCTGLNQLPVGRIDANAIPILNLFPAPNSGLQTYANSPHLFEHRNQFDVRGDYNPSDKDQIFGRYSFSDDPDLYPGHFRRRRGWRLLQPGPPDRQIQPDGGGIYARLLSQHCQPGPRRVCPPAHHALSDRKPQQPEFQTSTASRVSRSRPQPAPRTAAYLHSESAAWPNWAAMPSCRPTKSARPYQITDDFTRIYGRHSFKMGVEYQNVKFSTLQPAWSHGQFNYGGGFTDIPNLSQTTGGIPQMMLPPTTAQTVSGVPIPAAQGGFDYSGGSDGVYASNINTTYDQRIYFATYFQDDWKVTPKLTLNLGIRWDYFGPINETNGGQANFVPYPIIGRNFGGPTFILPASGKDSRTLSTGTPSAPGSCQIAGFCYGFQDLLAKDGITLDETGRYGKGLVQTQKDNFAPRIGFAYQVNPKLVTRGGIGLFFNSFENQGYSSEHRRELSVRLQPVVLPDAERFRPEQRLAGRADQLQFTVSGLPDLGTGWNSLL